jgi:hypothetical protein
MEIRQKYIQRYLHDIAIDQLVADYQAKGYQVTKEEKVGEYSADLVAKREGEVVVVEVKTEKMTAQKRKQVAEIGDYVRSQKNYKFLVVVATPPKPKRIDIPNIELLLFDYLIENFSQDFDRLSSHTRITDVSEATVDEVTVNEDGSIAVKGNGTVEVELQYGSTNDGAERTDSFPFNFDVILKYKQNQELFLADAENIDVDVSSFYE